MLNNSNVNMAALLALQGFLVLCLVRFLAAWNSHPMCFGIFRCRRTCLMYANQFYIDQRLKLLADCVWGSDARCDSHRHASVIKIAGEWENHNIEIMASLCNAAAQNEDFHHHHHHVPAMFTSHRACRKSSQNVRLRSKECRTLLWSAEVWWAHHRFDSVLEKKIRAWWNSMKAKQLTHKQLTLRTYIHRYLNT